MTKNKAINAWLLIYLIGSIPVLLFYAAGLSGWFFDYPIPLFLAIFFLLAIPLILILIKHPKAPQWNIALVWIASILIILRIVFGIFFQAALEGRTTDAQELYAAMPTFVGIIIFSLAWAIGWTKYFKKSVRNQ